ncbi:MAG: malate dehydrogenase [Candidatus Omnitrophica bacterium]|nr:malate dehydrogenase [Candidatus Omnitrophota bacterium]
MKIAIIGTGNVGGTLALELLGLGIEQLLLIDTIPNLAEAKALDLEDALAVHRYNRCVNIRGSQNIEDVVNSNIVIITAGFSRRAGMTREELLKKNALIVKEISLKIKPLCPQAIILVVTNPVDIITYLVLKTINFSRQRVLGIGTNLDAARFANLISRQLNIACSDIETLVIGAHGETMLPLERFTAIRNLPLNNFIDDKNIKKILEETVNRGTKIVSRYSTGSAYFGPAVAIARVIRAIINDEHIKLGVSAYLDGEYGSKDICIGVPCILGKVGIENIVELKLNSYETEFFLKSIDSINQQKEILKRDGIL